MHVLRVMLWWCYGTWLRYVLVMLVHVETHLGCYGICMKHILWYLVEAHHWFYSTCFWHMVYGIIDKNHEWYGIWLRYISWYMVHDISFGLRSILDIGHMVWDILWYMFEAYLGTWLMNVMVHILVQGWYGTCFDTWLIWYKFWYKFWYKVHACYGTCLVHGLWMVQVLVHVLWI
jgi:hypothetical protein